MQKQIHGAEAGDAVHQLEAESAFNRCFFACRVDGGDEVIMSREQEAARAAGGIADGVPGFGRMTSTMRDQGAGKVLSGPAFTSSAFF